MLCLSYVGIYITLEIDVLDITIVADEAEVHMDLEKF